MDPLTIIVCLHTAYIHTHIYKEIKEIYVFFKKMDSKDITVMDKLA